MQRAWHYELWNSRRALRSVMHISPRHLPAMEHREGEQPLHYFVLVEPTFEDGTAPHGRLVLCPWRPYLVDADALARWRPLDAAWRSSPSESLVFLNLAPCDWSNSIFHEGLVQGGLLHQFTTLEGSKYKHRKP